MNSKDFDNGCFAGDWAEYEVKNVVKKEAEIEADSGLTMKQRKDLATLLLELESIKNDFEKIAEHKDRLTNLMKFYNGGITAEH